jgi:predicted nucleic acid-binding protein
VISAQNLFELTAVLIHGYKIPPKEAVRDIKLISQDPLLDIIYPDHQTINQFLILVENEKAIHTADLYLVASAIVFGIEVIISADLDLTKLKTTEITIYNPFP